MLFWPIKNSKENVNMKKMLSALLSVCLLLALLPTTVFAADQTAEAGARIVEKSYDESTQILTVDMQIKLPDAVGITSVATMISYDSSKLTLIVDDYTAGEKEQVPTSTRTTLADTCTPATVALKTVNNALYSFIDSALYGAGNRAGLLITLGKSTPGMASHASQNTTEWLSIYSLRFKVSGPAATTLDSTSLRIADPKLENELVKYTYDNAHVNNYYTVAVVDGQTGLEYYFGKMQDNPDGELSGIKHLMAAEGNNTATYPGSNNTPPLPEYTGTIATPTVKTNKAGTVELDAAVLTPADSTAKIQYGYSKTDDGANITWQDGTTFSGLTVGDTLYFYAKVVGTSSYAEKVSAASAAVIVASKTVPTCAAPTGVTATFGSALSTITLTNPTGNTDGKWYWMDDTQKVGNVKDNPHTYKAKFVPNDTANFSTVENIDVTVNATKVALGAGYPIMLPIEKYYTGSVIEPIPTIKTDNYGDELVLNQDYKITKYEDNTNVGDGKIFIAPLTDGNYSFTAGSYNFTIKPADSSITITGNPSKTYDGAAVTDPAVSTVPPSGVTVTYAYYTNEGCTTKTTTANSGAASDGAAPKNAGDYWVKATVAASTNYNAATSDAKKFTISKKDLTIKAKDHTITYGKPPANNGATCTGFVMGENSLNLGGTLVYHYNYTAWDNVGTYTITPSGVSSKNYEIAYEIGTLTVAPKSLSDADVTVAPILNQLYTGSEIKPATSITYGAKELTEGVDFDYGYTDNTYVGTATLTVNGKGNYTGTKNANFTIDPAAQTISGPASVDVAFGATLDLNEVCSSNAPGAALKFALAHLASMPVGTSFDATNGTVTAGNKTGSFNVTVDSAAVTNYTAALQRTITVYIKEKMPSTYDTVPTAKTGLEYDGSEQELVTAGVANGGTVKYSLDGTTWTDTVPTGKDANTYNVQYKIVGDTTHSDSTPKTHTVTIAPKEVTVSGITANNKMYDRGNSATIITSGVTFGGIVSGDTLTITATGTFADADAGNGKTVTLTLGTLGGASVGNYKLATTGNQTTTTADITAKEVTVTGITATNRTYAKDNLKVALTGGTLTGVISGDTVTVDLTNAKGTMTDANVGNGKAVTVTGVKLGGADKGNYRLKEQPTGVTVNITKATALTLADIPVSQKYTVTTGEKAIGAVMPADAGTLTYTRGTASKTGSVAIDSWAVDATGKVTYTLSGGAAGDTVTLPVIIKSTNYADTTVNVVITLTAKDDQAALTLTGETTVVYGQTLQLGTSGGNGNGAVTYTVTPGTGTATIDATGKLTPTKAGTVTVTATKAADANYNAITSAPVTITITKATPTGEPKYTAITTSGKTLADAGLTTAGSNLSVPGTVKWVDDTGADLPATTTVEANTTYKWLFTPTDTNYTTLTGSIQLWHKSTSSGGGSYYAPPVPDMPMLYRGCTGDAVKTLQEKLNAKGFDSGNVDGIFGAKTYAAATAFQKANGLGVDGIVGKLTWAKLYDATPVNVTPVTTQPMLRTGSRGDAVRKLQELLNAKGYTCGSVDGIFGSKTYAAVLAFQKANGLAADGIVGSLTWGKLV